MACKAGGADTASNRQLVSVIAEAKAANVPNDVINRNIDKAASADTADFKESTFEYYGHGGVGLIVNVVTDNGNRATNDVHLVAKKKELKGGCGGSVAFNFYKKARIDVKGEVLEEDALLEMCMEVQFFFITSPPHMNNSTLLTLSSTHSLGGCERLRAQLSL